MRIDEKTANTPLEAESSHTAYVTLLLSEVSSGIGMAGRVSRSQKVPSFDNPGLLPFHPIFKLHDIHLKGKGGYYEG